MSTYQRRDLICGCAMFNTWAVRLEYVLTRSILLTPQVVSGRWVASRITKEMD